MGRNDVCFCGSGKKQKNCHQDIHPDSAIANLYRVYEKIDKTIEDHYNNSSTASTCKAGCSYCCNDNFLISDIEFALILREISTWEKEEIPSLLLRIKNAWDTFSKDYPEEAELINKDFTSDEEIESYLGKICRIPRNKFSCVFLNEETKHCDIYKVRPFTCRMHGTAFIDPNSGKDGHYVVCGILPNDVSIKDNQADLSTMFEEISKATLTPFSTKYKTFVVTRPSPIFFSMYKQFVKNNEGFETPLNDLYFNMSMESYVDAIIEKEQAKKEK